MAFDKTKPAGTTPLKTADDQIRANNEALETAIGQDHDFATGDTQTGKHKQVIFKAPLTVKPTLAASEGASYTKDVSAKAELHFEDEDGNEVQLTSGGKINAIRGSAKAVLRIISVKFEKDTDHYVTITSIWNGDTLSKTEVTGSARYYDFNVAGNCLGVLGVFVTAAASGAGGNPLTNANLWASVNSGNLRMSVCNVNNSSYDTFAEVLSSNGQYITMTIAYLTDA